MAGRFLREPRLPHLCSPWHLSNQDSQLAGHQLRAIWKSHPDPQDKTSEMEAGLAVELGFSDLRKPPQKCMSPLAGRRGRSPQGQTGSWAGPSPRSLPAGTWGGAGHRQGARRWRWRWAGVEGGSWVAWQPHVGGERRGEIQTGPSAWTSRQPDGGRAVQSSLAQRGKWASDAGPGASGLLRPAASLLFHPGRSAAQTEVLLPRPSWELP